MRERLNKIRAVVPYLAAAAVCILVSLPAGSQSVVLDEAYSAILVRGNIGEIIKGAAADVHPPLYYLILKCSSFFGGESLTKYRLVTLAATWLNLFLLGAGIIRRHFGERVSLFYILWFGAAYATLDLSVYVRMYSWGAFFVTAAALSLYLYYKEGGMRRYVCAVTATLAAMYTHYYAVMAVFFLWLILLAAVVFRRRERLRQVLLGGVLVAAGYLPWLGVLLQQSAKVADDYWISEFDWRECILAPAHLWDSSFEGMGLVLYVPAAALLLRACLRRNKAALACFAAFAATMLTGGLFSVLVAPIWQDRYLYVAWGLLSLFVALAAGEGTGTRLWIPQVLLLGMLCVAGKFSLDTMLEDEWMTCSDREWVDFLEDQVAEDAVVIVDDPYEHRLVYQFYLPDARIVMVRNLLNDQDGERLAGLLQESGEGQLWYVVDYNQQQCGVERMKRMLAEQGGELVSAGAYTIKQKSLEIFAVNGP